MQESSRGLSGISTDWSIWAFSLTCLISDVVEDPKVTGKVGTLMWPIASKDDVPGDVKRLHDPFIDYVVKGDCSEGGPQHQLRKEQLKVRRFGLTL
jgi:hypothetical protein